MRCEKNFDYVAIILTTIAGIAATVLAFLGRLELSATVAILVLSFSVFSLLVLTIILARTVNYRVPNCCLNYFGKRLLIAAMIGIVLSVILLVIVEIGEVALLILTFLIAAAFTYTILGLVYFLYCLLDTSDIRVISSCNCNGRDI